MTRSAARRANPPATPKQTPTAPRLRWLASEHPEQKQHRNGRRQISLHALQVDIQIRVQALDHQEGPGVGRAIRPVTEGDVGMASRPGALHPPAAGHSPAASLEYPRAPARSARSSPLRFCGILCGNRGEYPQVVGQRVTAQRAACAALKIVVVLIAALTPAGERNDEWIVGRIQQRRVKVQVSLAALGRRQRVFSPFRPGQRAWPRGAPRCGACLPCPPRRIRPRF